VRASLTVAAVAALICASFAGTARADLAAVPNDAQPSSGGIDVVSPLEAIGATIASAIAGRTVSVRCEPEADWTQLGVNDGFAPESVLGFVTFSGDAPSDHAELAPSVCDRLQAFAAADVKPTKCAPPLKAVRTRVVKFVHGKRIVTSVTQAVRAAAQPAPCFVAGREQIATAPFWTDYFGVAQALQTLVHEAIHLQGDRVEAEAECYGMQRLAFAAQQLGDTPDDAAAIAQYYATRLYPQRRTLSPAYWSPECRANGRLDLSPGDGMWP
jgi:hypothetical protein